MSIEGKNHRQPSVDVRVSEGTRAMARPAALKFADLDQEHAFWITTCVLNPKSADSSAH